MSKKPKVFITRKVPSIGLKLMWDSCEITQWDKDEPIPQDELLKRVVGIDALFCLLTDNIDAQVLDAAGPSLKVVATMSVGYDHIKIQECAKRKITVGNTGGVSSSGVAEFTVALMLAVGRRIKEGIRAVETGTWGAWKPMWLCGPGLEGSTIGIVGFGSIGFAVAKLLVPFGIKKILYSDVLENPAGKSINATFVPFDDLVSKSDYVVACCALTASTNGIFNKNVFKKMKNNAIFINTSRGGVMVQDDLYEALKSGQIYAAGLDVTMPEPLPTDSLLLTLDNCTVLPHIASATTSAREAMSELTAKNILMGIKGEPMPSPVKI